jgi:signal transduction histidine kinase
MIVDKNPSKQLRRSSQDREGSKERKDRVVDGRGVSVGYCSQPEDPMKIPGRSPSGLLRPPVARWDAILLVSLFIVNCSIFSAWTQLLDVPTKPWLLFYWLYGLVSLVPLAWRNRAPVAIYAIQWLLTVAAWPFLPHYCPFVGLSVALYAVSAQRDGKTSLLALLASLVPYELVAAVAFRLRVGTFADAVLTFSADSVLLVIVALGAWAAGRASQARRRQVQRLERERQTTREAITAERRRVARELHDIVSHAVTVIVLQAAGAARVAKTDFHQVTRSLAHIETTGKQAMTELRRLLGVLDAASPTSNPAPAGELGPQPGLADLPTLVDSLRATGMPITVQTSGTPHDLDPSVDLTAYRIAQEGLTNVLKHAGTDTDCRVQLAWEAQHLRIQIDNDSSPAETHRRQALSTGRGLIGLRERVHAVGGRLHTEPHHDGYRLCAVLPLANATPEYVAARIHMRLDRLVPAENEKLA